MENNKSYLTVLTISTGLLVFYLVFKINTILLSALVLSVICILSSFVAEKVHWVWMKLAHVLGLVNSKILLSVIFFLVLLPLAWLSRLFGKTTILLKKKKGTYYTERGHQYEPSDFENTW